MRRWFILGVIGLVLCGLGAPALAGTAPVTDGNAAQGSPAGTLSEYIVPVGIKFQDTPSGGNNEFELSRRGVLITDPVWVADVWSGVKKNDPVCYRKNSGMWIKVDIAGRQGIPPEGAAVRVQCQGHDAITGAQILAPFTQSVYITSWSQADYEQLYFLSECLPLYVTHIYFHLVFDFWMYDRSLNQYVWTNQYETGPHVVHVVMGTPKAPMAVPWEEVIYYSTEWCDGLSDESAISNDLVQHVYNATWQYDGTQTHTTIGSSWTDQTLRLAEMLGSGWADCKDFGNFYTCLMNALGCTSEAYLVFGPFTTRPILGARHSTWTSFGWNHHQFGWHASLVHDASLKVDQSAPKHPIDMARDTTYKGYLYQSGTWSPYSSLTCKVQ